jgi:hypothetical protein
MVVRIENSLHLSVRGETIQTSDQCVNGFGNSRVNQHNTACRKRDNIRASDVDKRDFIGEPAKSVLGILPAGAEDWRRPQAERSRHCAF